MRRTELGSHWKKIGIVIAASLVAALLTSWFIAQALKLEAVPVAAQAPATEGQETANQPPAEAAQPSAPAKEPAQHKVAAPSEKRNTAKTPVQQTKIQQPKVSPARGNTRPSASSPVVWQGIRISGSTIRVTKAQFQHLTTKGLKPILNSAKMEPVIDGKTVSGFRLVRVSPGSLWAAAGYQKGDMFTSINGMPLKDISQAIRILQMMKQQTRIQIQYQRRGQNRSQTILVE